MSASRTSARSAEGAPAVELEGLAFDYGREGDGFQLSIDALRIEAGQALACIGPSGSGKSTFLALISGNALTRRGQVRTLGEDWAALSDAQRRRLRISRLGLVFQEFALFDHLSVRENVLLPYFVNPALRLDAEVEARARELAEAAGILAHLTKKPRRLSQGERQRVALCRALVTRPDLILADEPTGNLDPHTSRAVVELMLRERERHGASLVVVTHDHGLLPSFERVLDFADYASHAPSSGRAGGRA